MLHSETEQDIAVPICNRVHRRCIVCGSVNSKGLGLKFDVTHDKNVHTVFNCLEAFEGYRGMLHGGVISTLLDAAMGHCMFARGMAAVTVEMTIRFRQPVLTGKEAEISASVMRGSHPLYLLEAEIVQDGNIKATAKGKFYHQPELNSTP